MAADSEATGTTPKGVTAWDPKAGVSDVLDADTMTKRFAAGEAHVVAGHTYAMAGPDGEVWHIPAESVPDAAGKGMIFVDHRTNVRAQVAAESGWQAAGQGALNITTAGLGEAALAAAGADPVALEARKEQTAYTVGQAGGAVLGAMIAPQALLGRGVAGLAAETLGAGAMARVAAAGIGTAVEGATYAAGNAVSEASLGRTEDVADHVLAATGLGALLGAATHGAGALLGKGLKFAGDAGKRAVAGALAREADAQAARVSGSLAAGRVAGNVEQQAAYDAQTAARTAAERTHTPLDLEATPVSAPEGPTALAGPTDVPDASTLEGRIAAMATRRVGGKMAAMALGGPMGYVAADLAASTLDSPAVRAKVLQWARNATLRVAQTVDEHAAAIGAGAENAAATGRYLERRIAGTTASLLSASTPSARREAFAARQEELASLSDPATQAVNFDRATAHLNDAMPDTRALLHTRGTATLAWLQSQIPRSANPDRLDPHVRLNDHDIMRWSRLDAVAQDPLRAMERGSSKAEVEAVAVLYPSLHATMQKAIAGVLKAGMNWNARKAVSYKWGIETHNAFVAGSIHMSQESYKAAAVAAQQAASAPRATRGGTPSGSQAKALRSPTDALTGE